MEENERRGTEEQNLYQQNSYQQNACQQGSYQQNPYQQNSYQQNAYQQNSYQQGFYRQPPYPQPGPGGYGPGAGQASEMPMKTSEWLLTLLVLSIPCVGLIMMLIWGFGSSGSRNRANYCRAMLIWRLILWVFLFLVYMVAAAGVVAALR